MNCSACGIALAQGRVLSKCRPCHKAQVARWRRRMHSVSTPEFPGVDIDAIHYKRGAVRKPLRKAA